MAPILSVPATIVPYTHAGLAALAFCVALFAGFASGLWQELCANSVAKWPVEWFPSVSATIGDHAAARAPFQILIALTAGPRFMLILLQWLSHRQTSGQMADAELFVGLARTFCAGGWMYITSRDSHSKPFPSPFVTYLHDLFMIVYLVLTLPWMLLSVVGSRTTQNRKHRTYMLYGFLGTLPPLIWQYYRHSVLRIPGAYTYYSFFEWGLVFWDVGFDALAVGDVSHLRVTISDDRAGDKPYIMPVSRGVPLDDSDWTRDGASTRLQAVAAYCSDVMFAICFWTVFTSLVFQLFYWSVWELALAGSELALLANVSPFLLSWASIRRWVASRDGLLYLRTTTVLLGMGCYAAPLPVLRMIGIFIGTAAGWLAVLNPLIRAKGSEEVVAEGQILMIGLVITAALKYINSSINPLWATADWSSGGWNITGLFLAGVSLFELSRRPASLFAAAPEMVKEKPAEFAPPNTPVAIGFGSLIHLLHTFATDCGTIISWTWTGFPITGPTIHPFGGLLLLVMCAVCLIRPRPIGVAFFGCASAAGLYLAPDWGGYYSGLVLVGCLITLFPSYLQAAASLPPARTFGVALAVYCVLDVVAVVTVAYAFVPLGNLVRERTDLVLGFCVLSVLAGATQIRPRPLVMAKRSVQRIRSTYVATIILAGVVGAGSIAYGYWKMPGLDPPKPYHPNHRLFTGGIWTVHFGVDAQGRDSQRRMRDLLRDMEVDVVGLLESDLHRMVYGNRDLTRVIADELGYYVDLGPGPNKHTWGAALLSKFPILNSTHHLLPSPHGELAPAIHATLDIHGTQVNVVVSHNGQEEDPLDRELQTKEIARLLALSADTPTIFLGYLVTTPHAKRPDPYEILMVDGQMHDIEIEDQWRWCEYIAFRGLWRVAYARVYESDITDTELQVGRFLLPRPGEKAVYESNEQNYWHIGEMDVPEPWRLPGMFRDEGVRGHRYVVWKGPIYYMPPVHSGLQRYGWGWGDGMDTVNRTEDV